MITPVSWEKPLKDALAASYPLMLIGGAILIAVTVYLMARGNKGLLAVWLAYMYMP